MQACLICLVIQVMRFANKLILHSPSFFKRLRMLRYKLSHGLTMHVFLGLTYHICPGITPLNLDFQDCWVFSYICWDCFWVLGQSVDYGKMAEILVQRAAAPDEFTRLTSFTWVGCRTSTIYFISTFLIYHCFCLSWVFHFVQIFTLHKCKLYCLSYFPVSGVAGEWICEAGRWATGALLCWHTRGSITCHLW